MRGEGGNEGRGGMRGEGGNEGRGWEGEVE